MLPFWRRKKKRSAELPFGPVRPTVHLAEYVGTVPAFKATGTRHRLVCTNIGYAERVALLGEGFKPFGNGQIPTHGIFCVVNLASDPHRHRLVFNIYIDLSRHQPLRQNWIAANFTQALARQLTGYNIRGRLLPCIKPGEFDFCWPLDEIEYDWMVTASAIFEAWDKD